MEQDIKNNLFSEFPPVETATWEKLIYSDLKGQDYDKKLIWQTIEGFNLKPYYRKEDMSGIEFLETIAGDYPYLRGNTSERKWLIRHELLNTNPGKANKEAKLLLSSGVNLLGFDVSEISNKDLLAELFEGIDVENTPISLINASCNRFMRTLITELSSEIGFDQKKIEGFYDIDPIGMGLINGNFGDSYPTMKRKLYELFDSLDTFMPQVRAINVKGNHFHNAGATAVQELAFAIALGNEYLVMQTDQDLPINKVAPFIQLSFGIGSNYFIEIAKLRAARILWSKVVNAYGPKTPEICKTNIHAISSSWNKSIYDPHTNILRETTEAMSAIIGGADIITIQPFDKVYKEPDDFSYRISKNIQILLKEESFFDKVVDPAAGSYYIEVITNELVKNAWELFKTIENKGGFIESSSEGFIQDKIAETNEIRKKMLVSRKENILGVNLYPETNEKVLDKIDEDIIESFKIPDGAFRTISLGRKSEPFEQLRLKTEKFVKNGGKQPTVFMLPYGNPAMASARQIFSRNFFGVAGYKIIENSRFNSVEEGVIQSINQKTDILVICSSDEEDKTIAPQIANKFKELNRKIKLVIAGYPTEIVEELKTAGIDDFIHIRTNLLECLNTYQDFFQIH